MLQYEGDSAKTCNLASLDLRVLSKSRNPSKCSPQGGKQQVQLTFKIIAFSISNCHKNSLSNAIKTKTHSHTKIVKENSA